jgi:hypothetical protein
VWKSDCRVSKNEAKLKTLKIIKLGFSFLRRLTEKTKRSDLVENMEVERGGVSKRSPTCFCVYVFGAICAYLSIWCHGCFTAMAYLNNCATEHMFHKAEIIY